MPEGFEIETAGPDDDRLLADHYLAIWDSYGTPAEDYAADMREKVLLFIEEARQTGFHAGFIARAADGAVAGSAICCSTEASSFSRRGRSKILPQFAHAVANRGVGVLQIRKHHRV